MKKSVLALALCLFFAIPTKPQGVLSKVKNTVTRELSGNSETGSEKSETKASAEPSCACSDAILIIDLEKFKIDYKEISVSMKEDGSILVKDRISRKYYISKNGATEGPFNEGDPRLIGFEPGGSDYSNESSSDDWTEKFPGFISKTAGKYTVEVNGKSYGPYAQINDFAVSRSKTKFAAIVIENVLITEDQGKQMEEAIKNAKTDQERMEIAMKYSQQMQQSMMQGGGAGSLQPKLVSNIPGAISDPMNLMGGALNSNIKYDDILMVTPDKIIDLQGKSILTLDNAEGSFQNLFVNSSNSQYARYNYGTLTFSDKKILSELFNPYLTRSGDKVFLAYMYYSPSKNSVMQCKIPF
jgi:hypothetical protein